MHLIIGLSIRFRGVVNYTIRDTGNLTIDDTFSGPQHYILDYFSEENNN